MFFNNNTNNKFLTLVCENDKTAFVKNFGIYFINNKANINGYWGEYFEYAKGLKNKDTNNFSDFYSSLKSSIRSVVEPNESYTINFIDEKNGLKKLNNYIKKSSHPDKNIYFHFVSRRNISKTQFEKVKSILGYDVAKYLKESNLTVHFTDDISKQKSFILKPDYHKNDD